MTSFCDHGVALGEPRGCRECMREHIADLHDAIKPLADLADAIDRCYEGGTPCAGDQMAGVIEYGQAAKLRELLKKGEIK